MSRWEGGWPGNARARRSRRGGSAKGRNRLSPRTWQGIDLSIAACTGHGGSNASIAHSWNVRLHGLPSRVMARPTESTQAAECLKYGRWKGVALRPIGDRVGPSL